MAKAPKTSIAAQAAPTPAGPRDASAAVMPPSNAPAGAVTATTEGLSASVPVDASAPIGSISDAIPGGEPPATPNAAPTHAEPEADGHPAQVVSEAAPVPEEPSMPASAGYPADRVPGTGEAEGADAALAAPEAAISLEEVRAAQRAGVMSALTHFAEGDEIADELAFVAGLTTEVLSWRLAEDALIVVTTDGRKYRLDRGTGIVIDTATGEEVA